MSTPLFFAGFAFCRLSGSQGYSVRTPGLRGRRCGSPGARGGKSHDQRVYADSTISQRFLHAWVLFRGFASFGDLKASGSGTSSSPLPEVILARELELCYLNISLITDYDMGVEGEGIEAVTHEEVIRVFEENNQKLRDLLFAHVPALPAERDCPCAPALEGARFEPPGD